MLFEVLLDDHFEFSGMRLVANQTSLRLAEIEKGGQWDMSIEGIGQHPTHLLEC